MDYIRPSLPVVGSLGLSAEKPHAAGGYISMGALPVVSLRCAGL
jgi:hypothetical protein